MAGIKIQLLPKRVFDFANLAVGGTQKMALVERIDVSQYTNAVVALQVHNDGITAGNSITFDLVGDGFTDDEPGLIFRTASPLFTSTSLTFSDSPRVFTYGGTARGHYAALVVTANKAVAGFITATVSIDLILRSPDDT
jgi:hypothetical protein